MAISITDYEFNCDTHDLYRVDFFDDNIETLVTHTPAKVRSWIQKIKYIHRFRLHELIVGLDIEWRPSFTRGVTNPVATLQLCVGHNCLIFQLCYCDRIPKCLFDFLANPSFTFVGVGVGQDVRKLADDYGLEVANSVDLRVLEARRYGWERPRSVSLKDMASEGLDGSRGLNKTCGLHSFLFSLSFPFGSYQEANGANSQGLPFGLQCAFLLLPQLTEVHSLRFQRSRPAHHLLCPPHLSRRLRLCRRSRSSLQL
ncbi:unnamed protein product, partial [Prunus brigantina]